MNFSQSLCLDHSCVKLLVDYLLDFYKVQLYEYNSMIKGYGVYLKPMHIVTKKSAKGEKIYYYFGRYWFKIEVKNSKIKWIYLGCKKPFDQLPDPPMNPLLVIGMKKAEENSNTICLQIENFAELSKQIIHIVNAFYECCSKMNASSKEDTLTCIMKRLNQGNEPS
ncbi:hypothetical protein QPL79_00460 [Ignisphaera sp. 4213-co]|uniref:Uncharacterized protein n=1 Tax=Ignisphaera cupida TaxID=3050454 RepID=A0ABD4Z3Q4_9CREN|nr:hypothetical protein [Ignisphaera sp. 4213-co]MDK6027839.1 hypothetical protein [Ignisphaera sp. 4213-co]